MYFQAAASLMPPAETCPAARAHGSGGKRRVLGPTPSRAASPFAQAPRWAQHLQQQQRQRQTRPSLKAEALPWAAPLATPEPYVPPPFDSLSRPQMELLFSITPRGVSMMECLAALQDAPPLTASDSAALEAAACLAQPFVMEEGNDEIVREGAEEASHQLQTSITSRYAREVAPTSHHHDDRRRRSGLGQKKLPRSRTLGDADASPWLGALEVGHRAQLPDMPSASSKLLIDALDSHPANHELKLPQQRQLVPPTSTIDLQEPDHAYLLPTLAGTLTGSADVI